MNIKHPLRVGTVVEFDIVGDVGTAVVLDAAYDGGWLYRLDVTGGDRADKHRHDDGELWACDFEVLDVKPAPECGAGAKEDSP